MSHDGSESPSGPRIHAKDSVSGNGAACALVVPRVVKEAGGMMIYPTLTRTYYTDWTLMMRVNL